MSGRPHSSTRTWVEHSVMADVSEVRKMADYSLALAVGSVIVSVSWDGRETKPVVVRLEKTRPHWGGVRCWFQCPKCRKRCGKLYATKTHFVLACRQCHGLIYYLQQRRSLCAAFWHWAVYHGGKTRTTRKVERLAWAFQGCQERGEKFNMTAW